uniref:Isochorismatase family protein n=1 Tax=candidate division WOR-3 bacterium TaxID=2052148 RepID=A0A7C4U6L4_UNCW3
MRNIKFEPESSALLIIDMQRYFLEKNSHAFLSDGVKIIKGIKRLQGIFLERNLPVIFTRHINNEENVGMMMKWWGEIIKEEDPLSEISGEFDLNGSIVLKKSQYDAFYNTELEKILKERRIRQVVITGVMTNLCCETTARSAFVRGFEVFFTIDGTATDYKRYHKYTIENLSRGFAVIITLNDIISMMNYEKR